MACLTQVTALRNDPITLSALYLNKGKPRTVIHILYLYTPLPSTERLMHGGPLAEGSGVSFLAARGHLTQ